MGDRDRRPRPGAEATRAFSGAMRARAAHLLVVMAVVTSCETAGASTVSVQSGEMKSLLYEAEPGEANELSLSTNGLVVNVQDPGAEIAVGSDCDSINDHQATCDLPGSFDAAANLRNGDDTAEIVGGMVTLSGRGQGGSDRMVGGASTDRLDGGPGPDVLRGRAGSDFVLYVARTDDLRVTLGDATRNDGGPLDGPLRDRVRGIERIVGGEGDDLLVGTGAENGLFSHGGRDVLKGKGGPDDFDPGGGRDRMSGGGADDVFGASLGRDKAFGGAGPDLFQMGAGGPAGSDLYDGGSGHDTLQTVPFGDVRISLDGNANDGNCADPACNSSDEGDNARGIEEVNAGFGDDVLIGSGRDEVFRPSSGADTVRARGGDDTVHLSMDGVADLINCGGGTDTIVGTPDATDMNPNCP